MSIHTVSSREFTRDVSAAKKAAATGPVFITDRGKPSHVLLSIEAYQAHVGDNEGSLLDMMDAIPGGAGIEFDVPALEVVLQPAPLD